MLLQILLCSVGLSVPAVVLHYIVSARQKCSCQNRWGFPLLALLGLAQAVCAAISLSEPLGICGAIAVVWVVFAGYFLLILYPEMRTPPCKTPSYGN